LAREAAGVKVVATGLRARVAGAGRTSGIMVASGIRAGVTVATGGAAETAVATGGVAVVRAAGIPVEAGIMSGVTVAEGVELDGAPTCVGSTAEVPAPGSFGFKKKIHIYIY